MNNNNSALLERSKQLKTDAVAVEAWLLAMIRSENCTVPPAVVRAIDNFAFDTPLPTEEKHNLWALTQQYQRQFHKEEGMVRTESVLQELRLPV